MLAYCDCVPSIGVCWWWWCTQATSIGVNPLYLMLPVTVAASFAFMLPVATPPNAIVFAYGHMKILDMVITAAECRLLRRLLQLRVISPFYRYVGFWRVFTPHPIGERSIVMSVSVCLSVCLCVSLSTIISSELHDRSSLGHFFMHITYDRGSVLF